MSESNGTCEYVLDPGDPETWGGDKGDKCYVDEEVQNEDGVWTCPHKAEEGENLCLFHLSVDKKDDEVVVDAFLNILDEVSDGQNPDEQKLQFLGGKFGTFDLSENPSDVFSGGLVLRMDHSKFTGCLNWPNLGFKSSMSFRGVKFSDDVSFHASIFDSVNFRDAEFGGDTHFDRVEFNGGANFRDAVFNGHTYFRSAKFSGYTYFTMTEFKDSVYFRDTKFEEETDFLGANYKNDVYFSLAVFDSDVNFSDTQIGTEIDFRDAKFNQQAQFDAIILEKANFTNADLTDASFVNTTLHSTNFEQALLSRATLFGADLRGAKLNGAVLGDVRIDKDTQFLGHPNGDSGSSPHTLSAIRTKLRCVYDPSYNEDNDEADVDKAKSVYRALEELAGKAARPRLQSQCFVRRQDLQKDGYKQDAKEADSWQERLIAGARYSRAKVSRGTLLYGESPWRIIGGSIGFVILAALLYPLGEWLRPVGGEAITYSRILGGEWSLLLESLYFSTLTFTTLGMGDYEPMGVGQVLVTINTALGAVLIALLVFVLGRRAAR